MTFLQGQPLKPGDIVRGHYCIIRLLGEGNFGETYLAADIDRRNEEVAVKRLTFISSNPAIFKKAKELFERESSVLCKLTDPVINNQIPKFFTYFEENQQFYLVQEVIQGQTLKQELRRVRMLGEDAVVELLEDVLGVLKFIHQKGIIHRDIKPENLMRRNSDRKFVLIDFGAVKEEVAKTIVNTASPAKGTQIYTPGYAPREQRQGDAKENSDIYALGMTAIEALTGIAAENLPEDRNTGEIIWRDKAQVSKGLAKILEEMVRDDWKKRYRSASEVLEALDKFKHTLIVSPRGQGQSGGTSQPVPVGVTGVISKLPLWSWFVILAPIVIITVLPISFALVKTILPSGSNVSNPSFTNKPTDRESKNKPAKENYDRDNSTFGKSKSTPTMSPVESSPASKRKCKMFEPVNSDCQP